MCGEAGIDNADSFDEEGRSKGPRRVPEHSDPETGLIYLRNRLRSAYGYVDDNPLNGTDPLGLWGWNPISDIKQAAKDVGKGAVAVGTFVGNNYGTIAQVAAGGVCIAQPELCSVAIAIATTAKVGQDAQQASSLNGFLGHAGADVALGWFSAVTAGTADAALEAALAAGLEKTLMPAGVDWALRGLIGFGALPDTLDFLKHAFGGTPAGASTLCP